MNMKMMAVKDVLADEEDEKTDFQDLQHEITEQGGGIHLLIVAIDSVKTMEIKSVTLHFQNRLEGLWAFNVLAATARNVHKTCVEDAKLCQTLRTQAHHL
jgi:hypothetical protein